MFSALSEREEIRRTLVDGAGPCTVHVACLPGGRWQKVETCHRYPCCRCYCYAVWLWLTIRHEQMGGYVEKKPFGFVEELRYLKNFREADLCPDSRRAPEDVAWAGVIVRG